MTGTSQTWRLRRDRRQAGDGSQMRRRGKVSLVRRWMMTSERLSGPVGVVQWAGVQPAGGDWLIPEWPSGHWTGRLATPTSGPSAVAPQPSWVSQRVPCAGWSGWPSGWWGRGSTSWEPAPMGIGAAPTQALRQKLGMDDNGHGRVDSVLDVTHLIGASSQPVKPLSGFLRVFRCPFFFRGS